MKKYLITFARICASVFAKSYYIYLFAKMVVGRHDNDSNANMHLNGESNLLYHLTKKQKLSMVFDVGAHVGNYSSVIVARNPKIKVYGFEPNQTNVERLQNKFQGLLNVNIVAQACSDHDGIIEFYQNVDSAKSSFDSVLDLSLIGKKHDTIKKQTPCISIDTFCKKNLISHINLLKIDTEGYEFKVLIGAQEMVSQQRIDYIQFEYGQNSKVLRTLLLDFVTFFSKYNYDLFVVHPKGLKPLVYSPYEENRYNMINFLAVHKSAMSSIEDIVLSR